MVPVVGEEVGSVHRVQGIGFRLGGAQRSQGENSGLEKQFLSCPNQFRGISTFGFADFQD